MREFHWSELDDGSFGERVRRMVRSIDKATKAATTTDEQKIAAQARNRSATSGLSLAEIAALEARGKCDLCGTTTPGGRNWHIDHDHACCTGPYQCGKCVRGLLCANCNLGLGYIPEDDATDWAGAAIAYLARPPVDLSTLPVVREGLTPEQRAKDWRLWNRYRMRYSQFEALLAQQGGGCALCATANFGGRHGVPHVDHDHKCCAGINSCGGCVRGLLCAGCNVALGRFMESVRTIGRIPAYLTDWKS